MEKKKIDLLDDKSEIARAVIGKMPPWLIRWGLSVFFIFILLFMILLYIIRFPDTIESPVTLTSGNPSISLIAESDGKISLRIADKQVAAKNDIIAVIENPARLEHVLLVKDRIHKFKSSLISGIINLNEQLPDSLTLGPLQYDYAEFIKLYKEYISYKTLDPISKVIRLSQQRLDTYLKLTKNIEVLKDLEQKRSGIAEKSHDRNSALLTEKVIAPQQFEESEASYLDALQLVEMKNIELTTVEIKIKELQSFITEQQLLMVQRDENFRNSLQAMSNKIESMIFEWEHDYLLLNPVEGTVNFLNFWTDHLYVRKGEQVCVVTPNHTDTVLGRAQVGPLYYGKIRTGQRVRIKLKNYPYHEFGMIVGKVKSISSVTNSSSVYFVNIELPQNLITTYKIEIPYQPDMTGVAEIELEEMSLLERVFYQFRGSVTHYVGD